MKKIILFLAIAGVCFSGYLSGVKFFSNTCAFNEPCPYFLGLPACYFGFAMFVIIAIIAVLGIYAIISSRVLYSWLAGVSLLGILFAGRFTLQEIPLLLAKGFGAYFFGLPTCALGLIFYLIIFGVSLFSFRRLRS